VRTWTTRSGWQFDEVGGHFARSHSAASCSSGTGRDEKARTERPARNSRGDCNSAEGLGAVLGAQLPQLDFDAILGFGLRGDNRAQVRYILARLTAYVQQVMDQDRRVVDIVQPAST
jgi:hypothetical protein